MLRIDKKLEECDLEVKGSHQNMPHDIFFTEELVSLTGKCYSQAYSIEQTYQLYNTYYIY